MLFSVEWDKKNEEVDLFLDSKGIDFLMKKLAYLKEKKKGEHLHFMTPSWGSGELAEQQQGEGSIVNHLCIQRVPEKN